MAVPAEQKNRAQASLEVGVLFNLYSKKIEKYQAEAQGRARWSFIYLSLAMFAGLGFVIWGHAVEGLVSAYITKTFLDLHRRSLIELSRYSRLAALNGHILTAQRLAEQMDEPGARRAAYEKILDSVLNLTHEDPDPAEPAAHPGSRSRPVKPREFALSAE